MPERTDEPSTDAGGSAAPEPAPGPASESATESSRGGAPRRSGRARAAPRRSTRLVLALGILAGLVSLVSLPLLNPAQVGVASDVYYHAAEAALAGEDFYAVTPPAHPDFRFLYPPIVVLAFVPHALLGDPAAAYALQVALDLAALAGTAWLIGRALERRDLALARLDRALLAGFLLAGVWTSNLLVMGQTTPWLALGIAAGLDVVDRREAATTERVGRPESANADRKRDASSEPRAALAGIAFGLAALVKVFPAVLGAYLLRRRRWRALGAAVGVGTAGLALGALAFGPETTVQWFTEVLLGRHESEAFAATPDPTRDETSARRQVAALLGAVAAVLGAIATVLGEASLSGAAASLRSWSALVPALALAAVAPPVAYCYRDLNTDARRLSAVLATLVGALLVLPLQPLYTSLLAYPLLVLLSALREGRARRLLLAGTLATFLVVEQQALFAALGGLPGGDLAVGALRGLFAFTLPVTVGFWLLLAGCVAVHRRTDVGTRDGEPSVVEARSASRGD